jgi:hypothetical protein
VRLLESIGSILARPALLRPSELLGVPARSTRLPARCYDATVTRGLTVADEEHITRLKQGWNAWRHQSREPSPELAGADLHDVNLSRADLRGAKLSGANLCEANLYGANLSD